MGLGQLRDIECNSCGKGILVQGTFPPAAITCNECGARFVDETQVGEQHHTCTQQLAEALGVPIAGSDVITEKWTYLIGNAGALQTKVKNLGDELHKTNRKLARAEGALRVARASRDDVWLWEDGGDNDPESLGCPVVMSADTCRELMAIEAAHSILHTCISELLTTSARTQMSQHVVETLREALARARRA